MHKRRMLALVALSALVAPLHAERDWYVSVQTGKGKSGTLEKPAKDLGNIIKKLEAGDRIHIAEGVYLGRGENGQDVITVPIEIYGGYDVTFSTRDPWGAHRTILSGVNASKNWQGGYRLVVDLSKYREFEEHRIAIDGVIVDNGDRNHYASDAQVKINRKANPSAGKNPTPESGGILVKVGKEGDIVIRNCVVMNTAPTGGAFSIWGNENSEVLVENNLAVNNTGDGFSLHSSWHPRDGEGMPKFRFVRNTSLLNEKHDPFATYGGSGLKLERDSLVEATHNVFAFNDYYGVDNARRTQEAILSHNLFGPSLMGDYIEFDTVIALADIEDACEDLDEAEENARLEQPLTLPEEWSSLYLARAVIDRNVAEADVGASGGVANELRSMLGLPLQGGTLDVDSEVWLPRLSIDAALATGASSHAGSCGCAAPAPESVERN